MLHRRPLDTSPRMGSKALSPYETWGIASDELGG